VDLNRVLDFLVEQKDDVGWGPNATFRFPMRGGTGAIWESLYQNLPSAKILFGKTAAIIDAKTHTVHCVDGSKYEYDALINTMPLDDLCRRLTCLPSPWTDATLKKTADSMLYSSTHIIGFGLEGNPPAELKSKCWMYFPEENAPFYRATVFSNYSPFNVPHPGEEWSLMCEVSESPKKPVDTKTIVALSEKGAMNCKLIPSSARILSRYHTRLEHGYPTPFFQSRSVTQSSARSATHTSHLLAWTIWGLEI